MRPWIIFLLLVIGIGGSVLIAVKGPERPKVEGHRVHMPMLSEFGKEGKIAFDKDCAGCHGMNGAGTDKGPPLIHRVYHPGHHGDEAFLLATKKGLRQHHWRFGDMPAQPQVADEQLASIVRFVPFRQPMGLGGSLGSNPRTEKNGFAIVACGRT